MGAFGLQAKSTLHERAVAKELGTNLREGDGGKTQNFKQLSVLVEELRCKITTRASRLQAGDMERVHEASMKLFPMLGWMASPVFGTLSGRSKKDRLESFSEAGLLTCDGCAKVHFGSHRRPRHDATLPP